MPRASRKKAMPFVRHDDLAMHLVTDTMQSCRNLGVDDLLIAKTMAAALIAHLAATDAVCRREPDHALRIGIGAERARSLITAATPEVIEALVEAAAQ